MSSNGNGTQLAGATSTWGRIAADGTAYARTPDGERAIGSWHAGSPEQGIAYYERRYGELATEVDLLARRAPAGDAAAVHTAALKLRESLPAAAVFGDLARLDRRLGEVLAAVEARRAVQAQERAAERERAAEAMRALVDEAERLAGASTDWKDAGARLRAIGDEWRGHRAHKVPDESALWKRVVTARAEFDRRRGAHFAELDRQRDVARGRKEGLIAEAEALASSSDWGATSARLRALLDEWKAAGRASKATEDELWERFRAARDRFYERRSETFAERDAEQRDNQAAKEVLVGQAEALDAVADPTGSRRRLRDLQQRWDEVGPVPREAMGALERRFAAAEDRVRSADEPGRRLPSEPVFVVKLREAVAEAEAKLAKAAAAGRPTAKLEEALTGRRALLQQAEQSGR